MNKTVQFCAQLFPFTRFERSGYTPDSNGSSAIDAIYSIASKVSVALLAFGVAAIAYGATTTVTINDPATAAGYNPSYFFSSTPANPETHVIGVYETRSDHSAVSHPEGTAYVHVSGTSVSPVILVLSSYEPTNWVLDGAGLSSVGKVLVNSYYDSRATGIDSSKVINKSGANSPLGSYAYEWSTTAGSTAQGLVQSVKSYFQAEVTSFSGVFRATDFSIDLVPNGAPPGVPAGTTGLYFNSIRGDYIGQGQVKTWKSADGAFTAVKNSDNGVKVSFNDGAQVWWDLNFAAPEKAALAPGTYTGATRYPFQASTSPGLDISGSGRGCNNLFGSFTITEMTYGAGDEILVFAADFEQHCEKETAEPLRGTVLFNAQTTTLPTGTGTGTGTTQDLLPGFLPAADSNDDGTVNLSIDVRVSKNHQGRQGKFFLAARAGSDLYLHDGTGWTLYAGGTLPAYRTGPLASITIDEIQGVNPGALSGVSIFVGYGVSDIDMLTNNRYSLVYTF